MDYKYFLFSLCCSMLLTFVVVHYAQLHVRFSADYDLHGVQKCHSVPVPRVGGVGIFAGLILSAVLLYLTKSPHAKFMLQFLIPSSIVFAVGFIEDITKRVLVSIRLLVTMLAALIGSVFLHETVRTFDIPILDALFQINVVAMIFTVVAVAGVANSINLIDGFNGLSSGVSLTAFVAFGLIAQAVGDNLLFTLSMISAGVVTGFLIWNYPKAKIFLGDGGAYLVGFVLAELSILINERHKEVPALFPLLVLLYPIFETLFSVYRRKIVRGVSPGAPDALHLHQIIHKRIVRWSIANNQEPLRARGNPVVSPYLWAMNLVAVVPAVIFWNSPKVLALFIAIFIVVYTTLYRRIVRFQTPRWIQRSRPHTHGGNTVVITANTAWYVFNFRGGLIRTLQERGYRIVVFAPRDDYVPKLLELGCQFCELRMRSASTNPVRDLAVIRQYAKLLKEHRPAVMLTFTPKANIYGAIAASWQSIPVITNVSGLGSAFIRRNWITVVARALYSVALKHPAKVFFQNEDDQSIFLNLGYVKADQVGLLPGSGVNIVKFAPLQSPALKNSSPKNSFVFLLVARMLRDKGIGEFVEAARIIKKTAGTDVKFQLVGFLGTDNPSAISQAEMKAWVTEGVVEYLGHTDNVIAKLANADCVVLPSYREGTPRTLLEAASMALPIITTDAPGCRNTVDDGVSGYLCKVQDVNSLVDCMQRMLALPEDDRRKMGFSGRNKMKRQFNEQIVFDAYLNAIDTVSRINRPHRASAGKAAEISVTA